MCFLKYIFLQLCSINILILFSGKRLEFVRERQQYVYGNVVSWFVSLSVITKVRLSLSHNTAQCRQNHKMHQKLPYPWRYLQVNQSFLHFFSFNCSLKWQYLCTHPHATMKTLHIVMDQSGCGGQYNYFQWQLH